MCDCESYRTIIATQDAIPENKTKTSPRAINTYTLSEIRDRKIFSFFARQDATTVDFAHSCETRRGLFSNPSRCRQARPAVTDQTNDRLDDGWMVLTGKEPAVRKGKRARVTSDNELHFD